MRYIAQGIHQAACGHDFSMYVCCIFVLLVENTYLLQALVMLLQILSPAYGWVTVLPMQSHPPHD